MPLKNEQEFMYYPEITSPRFNEEIYLKREFRNNEITQNINLNVKTNDKKKIKDFELDPHQVFLKNYISPDTPYNGILIFHGTGVGKTCSAISIAEGFKKTLKNINKKVLILSNLRDNFKKEIYDFSKENLSKQFQNINFQCTGKSYDLGKDSIYLTKNQKMKEVAKMIKSYYEFVGYIKFANDIKKKTNDWDGSDKNVTEDIKKFISKEFDDRVIIIDEIQNIKTAKKLKLEKTIQSILQSIIKYGKNIKLILMSATPMFDRADEIIFYLNLLLENDNRKIINKNDIFNIKEDSLKEGAEELLKKYLTGYVSYIRAEKPFIFPFRIESSDAIVPKNIKYNFNGETLGNKKIKFTNIICLKMNDIQNKTYIHYYNNKLKNNEIKKENNNNDFNEDEYENYMNNNFNDRKKIYHFDLTQISNIVYPVKNGKKIDNIGNFGGQSINYTKDNGKSGFYKNIKYIGSKKKIKYLFQKHALFNEGTVNEAPFCDEKHIKNYSVKYDYILKKIKESKGLIFLYSNYIEQGVLPLALMLEQNGFTRDRIEGEENLLEYSPNPKKGGGKREPICYLCGNNIKHKCHNNQNNKDFHVFKRAKYLLYYPDSKEIIKINKEEALNKFSNSNNKYGEEVKIFIGTKAVSEGLDFKRIRQVHIIDPWYNLSKHSQIIGRAIRKESHIDLKPEERNVEIYQYASLVNSTSKLGQQESIDLRNYRIAENKDILIKKINRILKESSVDCNLFRKTNIVINNKNVKQITSSGKSLNINIGDKAYSSMCDYNSDCNFKCNWTPNPKIIYPVNNDTFNISFGEADILKCKKIIINLFKNNHAYHLDNIEEEILKIYPEMNELFIYAALENLVNNKNEIVLDKFNIKGYILYQGDYYIFQPLDLEREDLPLIYRYYPISNKVKKLSIEDYKFDYPENEKINLLNNNTDIYSEIINKIENNIRLHSRLVNNNNNKNYLKAVIGCTLDLIDSNKEPLFIKKLLINYYNKNNNEYTELIIEYYNNNNTLINYFQDINYNKSKINKNIYIGYYSFDTIYVIDKINNKNKVNSIDFNNLKFVKASEEIKNNIFSIRKVYLKNTVKYKNFNIIYGVCQSELNKNKKERNFKIVDKTKEEKIITQKLEASKRARYTGRTCSFYKKPDLLPIRDKLNLYDLGKNQKVKIDFICNNIEISLRYYQLTNKDNKTWFIFEKK